MQWPFQYLSVSSQLIYSKYECYIKFLVVIESSILLFQCNLALKPHCHGKNSVQYLNQSEASTSNYSYDFREVIAVKWFTYAVTKEPSKKKKKEKDRLNPDLNQWPVRAEYNNYESGPSQINLFFNPLLSSFLLFFPFFLYTPFLSIQDFEEILRSWKTGKRNWEK